MASRLSCGIRPTGKPVAVRGPLISKFVLQSQSVNLK